MANPQKENGYVAIANEIMEALCKTRISGEARQILDTIFRKTYGFNKKKDEISISQFCRHTNLKKPTVVRAINKLIRMKVIIVIKNDNGSPNVYSINKNFDEWEPLPKKTVTKVRESSLKKFCYICGFDECVEKHHIKKASDGGLDRVENKIVLCPNCHTMVHRGKYTEGFLRTKKDNIENGTKKDNQKSIISKPKKIPTKDINTKDNITKAIKKFEKWLLIRFKIKLTHKEETEILMKQHGYKYVIGLALRFDTYQKSFNIHGWNKRYRLAKRWGNVILNLSCFDSDEALKEKLEDVAMKDKPKYKKKSADPVQGIAYPTEEEIVKGEAERIRKKMDFLKNVDDAGGPDKTDKPTRERYLRIKKELQEPR